MIVVCTACSAKFKVADEKVGPRGAKLRCSKCQTVFTVRRDADASAPAAPPPAEPPPRREPAREASPAPRSAEMGPQVDARSAFEVDLEPPVRQVAASPDPFAPLQPPEDPFGVQFPGAAAPSPPPPIPPAPTDPFGTLSPNADPFAAVQAPIPPELLQAPPLHQPPPAAPAPAAPAAQAGPDGDPFSLLPPLGGAPLAASADLALEERTTPPPRPVRPQSSVPVDDPFAGAAGGPFAGAAGGPFASAAAAADPDSLEPGHPSDIPPLATSFPGEPFIGFTEAFSTEPPQPAAIPPPAAPPPPGPPLREDPFAAAAVAAEPLLVAAPRRPGQAAQAAAPEAADRSPPPAGRLRAIAVNAISLAALLLAALGLLVVWRGAAPLSEALHPSALLSALGRARDAGPFQAGQVTSGFYERQRGAPLLFVKGMVVSQAAAPVRAVRVSVDVMRDGQALAHGEARLGAIPSPEELHQATGEAGLARLAAVAERAPTQIRPGETVPFLVVVTDCPPDLAGATLRVTADAEAGR